MIDETQRIYEQGHTPTGAEGAALTRVTFWLFKDDPEPLQHQAMAAALHDATRAPGDPEWANLARKDRLPCYSRTDGLV